MRGVCARGARCRRHGDVTSRHSSAVELGDVEDGVAGIDVEARRSEQSGADVARPERVPAAAVRSAEPLDLAERMDGEAARALQPTLQAAAAFASSAAGW